MKKTLLFITMLLFTAASQLQAQTIYYVSDTIGWNGNPASDPTLPWKTIDRALSACVPTPNVTYEVWVEEGAYLINQPLELTPHTKLIGGYPPGFQGGIYELFSC